MEDEKPKKKNPTYKRKRKKKMAFPVQECMEASKAGFVKNTTRRFVNNQMTVESWGVEMPVCLSCVYKCETVLWPARKGSYGLSFFYSFFFRWLHQKYPTLFLPCHTLDKLADILSFSRGSDMALNSPLCLKGTRHETNEGITERLYIQNIYIGLMK